MAQFKSGDVVKLRSGGPDMTVDAVYEEDQEVRCIWFAGNELKREVISVHALTSA